MINWRRWLVLVVLYLAAFLLQYGVLNNLGWGVLCPRLLLFFPVYAGVLRGALPGPGARAVLRLFARFGGGPLFGVKSVGLGLHWFFRAATLPRACLRRII